MAELILVLGGVRSGKSAFAEGLLRGAACVRYVATGEPQDAEMAERIAAHRARRPPTWATVETRDVAGAIASAPAGAAVLVDALGGWVADRMSAHGLWPDAVADVAPLGARGTAALEALVQAAAAIAVAAGQHVGGPVVIVADESGLGAVPPDATARRWLDVGGAVAQRLSAAADRVVMVVAGRPLELPAGEDPAPGRAVGEVPGADLGQLDAHGDRMVPSGAADFAVNVNGDGPPPHLRKVLDAALDDLGHYPDDGAARRAAADRHGRTPAEVQVTAGAADAFRLIAAALEIRSAAILSPTFTEPERALRAAGVPVVHVLRDRARGWALDPAAVPADADLVVLGNPNNPTGTLDPPERIAALCRPGRVTVVDEAFMDFVADPGASLADRADLRGLVVVRSVTKLWGVPGVRAGYLVADQELVAQFAAARQPWPVGALALAAIEACCSDEAYRREVADDIAAARAALAGDLAALPGVTVTPGAANFLLLCVPDGPATDAALRRRGVAVRPSTFPGLTADHLRVAVRDRDRNAVLVDALRDALAEVGERRA